MERGRWTGGVDERRRGARLGGDGVWMAEDELGCGRAWRMKDGGSETGCGAAWAGVRMEHEGKRYGRVLAIASNMIRCGVKYSGNSG